MTERLSLLTVHAHPDDEASKGSSTVARYGADGVHTVLVCCTGGEEGDILNPAMDKPEIRENLPDVRQAELDASAKIIGYDEVVRFGYRDSGMPKTEANARPDNFANAPEEEAVGKLVEVIRQHKPQVIITYNDDQEGYPHPDHLRVFDISIPAFALAGDPDAYPELGDPFTPSKLYYNVWSRRRIVAMHEKMLELGMESPFTEEWFKRPSQDERITTTVDIKGFTKVRRDSLLAHATQVDPNSRFWFSLPEDVMDTLYPFDEYVLADSRVESSIPETDLFAGVR